MCALMLYFQIFPFHLHYDKNAIEVSTCDDQCTQICSKVTEPELYCQLMKWMEVFAWPYFLKSV